MSLIAALAVGYGVTVVLAFIAIRHTFKGEYSTYDALEWWLSALLVLTPVVNIVFFVTWLRWVLR